MKREQLIDYLESVLSSSGRAVTVADFNLIPDILSALRGLGWVRTTERLPETERWVLGATRDEVREMRYRRNYLQSFWDNGDGHFPKPTYWCELPEPPKEETK